MRLSKLFLLAFLITWGVIPITPDTAVYAETVLYAQADASKDEAAKLKAEAEAKRKAERAARDAEKAKAKAAEEADALHGEAALHARRRKSRRPGRATPFGRRPLASGRGRQGAVGLRGRSGGGSRRSYIDFDPFSLGRPLRTSGFPGWAA